MDWNMNFQQLTHPADAKTHRKFGTSPIHITPFIEQLSRAILGQVNNPLVKIYQDAPVLKISQYLPHRVSVIKNIFATTNLCSRKSIETKT